MALTENNFVEKIEVMVDGVIRTTLATSVDKDGTEIGRSTRTALLIPGASTVGLDARVIAVANAVWTPEVIAAYLAEHPDAPPPA